jgi:hypothetical protein
MLPVALDTAPSTASATLPLRPLFRLDARLPICGASALFSRFPMGML